MNKLPDKPSKLLMMALADLEKVEADPRYEVDMNTWHEPNGKCRVCLAGSVMACTLGAPIDECLFYDSINDDATPKLYALNMLRCGRVLSALEMLGFGTPASLPWHFDNGDQMERQSDRYRPAWMLHMQTLIGILQSEGL